MKSRTGTAVEPHRDRHSRRRCTASQRASAQPHRCRATRTSRDARAGRTSDAGRTAATRDRTPARCAFCGPYRSTARPDTAEIAGVGAGLCAPPEPGTASEKSPRGPAEHRSTRLCNASLTFHSLTRCERPDDPPDRRCCQERILRSVRERRFAGAAGARLAAPAAVSISACCVSLLLSRPLAACRSRAARPFSLSLSAPRSRQSPCNS